MQAVAAVILSGVAAGRRGLRERRALHDRILEELPMSNVPSKVADRLRAGIKKFQKVVAEARTHDAAEADTVTIVTDMLAEGFGYDKYTMITSEFAIKSTYCDLAIKSDKDSSKLLALIEVKAVGLDLKETHTRQAVQYAATQGVDWVVLTNATRWQIYKVVFEKPVDQELVVEFDVSTLNPRQDRDIELLYLLCSEGWAKSALGEYEAYREALSKFCLAAMVVSEPVVKAIRRELRRACPDVKVSTDDIRQALQADVLKREVVEGDKADAARKRVARVMKKMERAAAGRAASHTPSGAATS